MIEKIKELFSLLSKEQKKQFYILQVLVIITAIFEVVGVASIIPFMALVADNSLIETNSLIKTFYEISSVASFNEFVVLVGFVVLATLMFSAIVSMITTWRLSMFASQAGAEIADRLFKYYLFQNWLFHASTSSADLTKRIANETDRITKFVIMPMMNINAKLVLVLFLSTAIFLHDPLAAMIGILVFGFAYTILFKLVRGRLHDNGLKISEVLSQRYKLMNEGFGGIKDLLLLGRQQSVLDRFEESGKILANSQGVNGGLSLVPRYFMELVAFGIMVALIIYLFITESGNLGTILPVLAVYALAGMKLLPAFQLIYTQIASVRGNLPAYDSVRDDLKNSLTIQSAKINHSSSKMSFKKSIKLQDIRFKYPTKENHVLDDFDLDIKANSTVGLVGSSGSGKSTAIDILMGLIIPNNGKVLVDDIEINKENIREWQNKIGFVSQSIFLSEGTIAQNIAFGVNEADIDMANVKAAVEMAHLAELIESLEMGLDTYIGERGVQLSGGQRQRIGIARALYHNAEVLVFDEATSALDGITEKMIMQSVEELSGNKTIIMIAHRLKTIKNCDQIFLLERGKVQASGNFQYLVETNPQFAQMAKNA